MPFAAPLGTVSVQDDENRWLVVGLAVNKVVVPHVEQFVGPVVLDVYEHLKTTQTIHQQSHTSHLTHYPANAPNTKLQYKNINSNATKDKTKWDFAVRCDFDFTKLFLLPHMAKSNSLQECDLSALTSIIKGVDDSPCNNLFGPVQKEAKDVTEMRNMWAHVKYSEWDEAQYKHSFEVMKRLISQLKVTPDVLNLLDNWETNGKHR